MRKITTGIPGLDEMIGGGLYEKSATLISGPPGTGKTTFGMQFIVDGIKQGVPGIIITFEEFPQTVYRDAGNFGWDLKSYEEQKLLSIIFTTPQIFKAELEKERGLVDRIVSETGARRILIDPVTYFHFLTDDGNELRHLYTSLVSGLRRCELTSMLLCEISDLFGELESVGERLPFVVDNVMVLRYLEIESEVRRALVLLKTRGAPHATDICEYEIGPHGVSVLGKFVGREGLLRGSPTRTPTLAERTEELF